MPYRHLRSPRPPGDRRPAPAPALAGHGLIVVGARIPEPAFEHKSIKGCLCVR
jgi:hypothetical protein